MKKSVIIGVALAASALTACSGGTDGTASTSSTSSSSSSSASAPSSSSSTASVSEDTTTTESGDDTSTGTDALVLDEQSTTWFTTFCNGFTGLKDSFTSVQSDLAGTSGDTPQAQQAAIATVISDLGTKLKGLATDTGSVPPPTVENGEQMATAAVDGFNAIGDAMINAADEFAATPVTDTATLQAAAVQLQTSLQEEATKAQTAFSAIDTSSEPGLDEAIGQIPECADLGA